MKKMSAAFLLFTVAVLTWSGTRATVQTLEGEEDLNDFLTNFRKGLLGMIALNLNITVNMTEELKEAIDQCKPTMEALTTACKSCTEDECQESPTFEDYLKLANPYIYLKEPLDRIGDQLETVGNLLKEEAEPFYNALKGVGNAVEDFPNVAKDVFEKLKKDLEKLKGQLDDLGIYIKDVTTDLIDSLKDLLPFKRRRRSLTDLRELLGAEILLRKLIKKKLELRSNIDPKIRKCMEKCPACEKLLLPTQQEIIGAVCGNEVIEVNKTIQDTLLKIQTAYNYTLDEQNPIVNKVVIDLSSLNSAFNLEVINITAYSGQQYITYTTGVQYPLFNMALGAKRAGVEYWDQYVVV